MTSKRDDLEALSELAKAYGFTLQPVKKYRAPVHSNKGKSYRTKKAIVKELLALKKEAATAHANWREALNLSKEYAEKAKGYKVEATQLKSEVEKLRQEAKARKVKLQDPKVKLQDPKETSAIEEV